MTLNEYQTKALTTAQYKDKVIYPALKILGEAGEVCEKIGKVYRDNNGEFTVEIKKELAKELGDVMWYIAVLSHDCGFDLETYGIVRNDSDVGKLFADETEVAISIRLMDMAIWASTRAVLYQQRPGWEKETALRAGICVELVQRLASIFGYTLQEILEMNVNKLADRKERGKIHGSGDNR